MTDDKKLTRLIETQFFVLGWVIAKHGFDSDGAYVLAKALKDIGQESVYVDRVLDLHGKDRCP